LGLDPMMSLRELTEMLEDLEAVPQLLRRSDIRTAFKLALLAQPTLADSPTGVSRYTAACTDIK
jgi:hypothetical protein